MTGSEPPASVGVRSVDFGHECLMFLVDRFYDKAASCPGARGPTCRRIEETLLFVRRLLEREEDLMRVSGYGDLPPHAEDHRAILSRLETLRQTLACSNYDNEAVASLLRDWCRDHVEKFDRPFAAYLESRRGTTSRDTE